MTLNKAMLFDDSGTNLKMLFNGNLPWKKRYKKSP